MMKILLSWFVTYHYIVCVDNIDRQRDALYWCINIINIIICLVWATTTTSVVVDKDELKNHPLLIIIIKCVDQDARQYSQYKHTGHTPHTTHAHTEQKEYYTCYRGNYKIKICASMSRRILWELGCDLWISNNFGV